MNSLVDLIKRIGIFMIAAQAVIHFAPGEKYAKYMKLVVGIMILLQFVSPMSRILDGGGVDWDRQLLGIEKELGALESAADFSDLASTEDKIIKNLEEEIKTKLNNDLEGEEYTVIKATVSMSGTGASENDKAYSMESVRILVKAYDDNAGQERISGQGKISIDKISVDTGDESEAVRDEPDNKEPDGICDSLKERFCAVLGIEERYMEVSVYGAVK